MRTTLKTESRGPQETRKRAGAGAAPASGWPAIAASEGKSEYGETPSFLFCPPLTTRTAVRWSITHVQ